MKKKKKLNFLNLFLPTTLLMMLIEKRTWKWQKKIFFLNSIVNFWQKEFYLFHSHSFFFYELVTKADCISFLLLTNILKFITSQNEELSIKIFDDTKHCKINPMTLFNFRIDYKIFKKYNWKIKMNLINWLIIMKINKKKKVKYFYK